MTAVSVNEASRKTPSRRLIWFARYGAIPFLAVFALLIVATFLFASQPAFYYMGFVVLILFGPILLAIALSYWLIIHCFRPSDQVPEKYFHPFQPVWISFYLIFVVLVVSLPFQGPLKLMFLSAKPTLDSTVTQLRKNRDLGSPGNLKAGAYTFRSTKADGMKNESGMHVFRFMDDSEQAFIHSPDGIANLRYNEGNKGRLIGDWYWMCED